MVLAIKSARSFSSSRVFLVGGSSDILFLRLYFRLVRVERLVLLGVVVALVAVAEVQQPWRTFLEDPVGPPGGEEAGLPVGPQVVGDPAGITDGLPLGAFIGGPPGKILEDERGACVLILLIVSSLVSLVVRSTNFGLLLLPMSFCLGGPEETFFARVAQGKAPSSFPKVRCRSAMVALALRWRSALLWSLSPS